MRLSLLALTLVATLAGATTYTPGVTNDCSVDVTAGLNTFFASTVTNGTALARNTVQLNGCYRIDGTSVSVPQRSFINIQGPAELRNVTAHAPSTSSALLELDRGTDISITDLLFRGTNTDKGIYVGNLEHEYALSVLGTQRLRVNRVYFRNVHGDGMSITPGGSWDGNGFGATIADNVIVQNSRFYSTGRHGITINAGSNIQILRNMFDEIGYLGIDQEVEAPAWYARNITVDSNIFGKVHIGAYNSSGFQVGPFVALQTDTIVVSHNKIFNANDTCIGPIGFTTNCNPTNVTVIGNKIFGTGSPIYMGGGNHVLISGNKASGISCGGGGAGVTLDFGNDITIDSNVFTQAPAAWRIDPGTPTHVATNVNATNNMCADGICSPNGGS